MADEKQSALSRQGPFGEFMSAVEQRRTAIEQVLPKPYTVDRFVKQIEFAFIRAPKLLECTKFSVIDSVLRLAELGLDPSGNLGSGYLAPFRLKGQLTCVPIPGYRGLIDLATRSEVVKGIKAELVYWGTDEHPEWADEFDVEEGDRPRLWHKPWKPSSREEEQAFLAAQMKTAKGDKMNDPRPVRAAYAVATLPNKERQFKLLYLPELERIRLRAPGGKSEYTPWATDRGAMYRKSPIRAICNQLALSPLKASLLVKALEMDEQAEAQDRDEQAEEEKHAPEKSATERLKQDFKRPKPEPEPEDAQVVAEPPDDVPLPTLKDQPKKP